MDPDLATPLDGIDPVVVFLSIALMALLRAYAPERVQAAVRPLIPILVLMVAILTRVVCDVFTVEGVSWQSFVRGVGAGVTAVWGHATVRSWLKRNLSTEATATVPELAPVPDPEDVA